VSSSKKNRVKRRLTLIFVLSLFVTGLVFGGIKLNQIEALKVKKIRITGAYYCKEAEIRSIASAYKGHQLIKVILSGQLKKKLQKQFSAIQSVRVSVLFPSVLTIKVVEKSPFAAFYTAKNVRIVASDGAFLEAIALTITPNAQVNVSGVPISLLTPDAHPIIIDKVAHIYAEISQYPELKTAEINFQRLVLSEVPMIISANQELWVVPDCEPIGDQFVILKARKLPIKMGGLESLSEKLKTLDAFFGQKNVNISSQNITYIDLRVPDRVIVKYE